MASIFDLFKNSIDDQHVDAIAKQIGADPRQTRDAMAMSIPAIVEAMFRKTEKDGSADPLHQRIQNEDSDSQGGSVLDELNRKIQQEGSGNTYSSAPSPQSSSPKANHDIFSEITGSNKPRVEDAIAKSSGLGMKQIGTLIAILGPLLMSMLAKQAKNGKMSSKDLDEMLHNDKARLQKTSGGGILGRFLDQDGDGDFDLSDVMKLGMSFFFHR